MPTGLRAAYALFSGNRTRFRNTWTLAAMENAFLTDIGTSRVEIYFRSLTNPLSGQETPTKAYEGA